MTKRALIKRANDMPILVLLLTLALFGCKKDEQPPPKPAAPAKKVVKVETPVQAQVSSVKPAEVSGTGFDFSKMKDPFKPYITEVPKLTEASQPNISPNALPIERYEVSSFKVSGIIVGLSQNTALVVDPAGKAYVVRPGMTIGSNNGRITSITRTTIEVDERINGKKTLVKLSLPQKK